jgi:hypothetical protein
MHQLRVNVMKKDQKDKMNDLETKRTTILESYTEAHMDLKSNLVKDDNGDSASDSHSNLNRWENYFCQLQNVHMINVVRQIEVHTAEPLVPEPSSLRWRLLLLGVDQIVAEFGQAGGNSLRSETYEVLNCIWNKEELPKQWKKSFMLFIRRLIELTVVISKVLLLTTAENFIHRSFVKFNTVCGQNCCGSLAWISK